MSSVTSSDTAVTNVPQEVINEFWENLITKKPAKVTKIFPSSLYANLLPPKRKPGTTVGKNAADSYESAASECRARVKRIVRECHRINEKFTDAEFDIEDLSDRNCLQGLKYWYKDPSPAGEGAGGPRVTPGNLGFALSTLVQSDVLMQNAAPVDLVTVSKLLSRPRPTDDDGPRPGSVHRVDWIFDKPQFEIDGFHSSDVVQGSNGDCWFIAALATICSNPALIKKVCVARDEECGVYGFVFYRDGEWIWTVVDDNLYLRFSDFDALGDRYDPTGIRERKWKKNHQTGSEALYFASCANENETWLPLLEKAYAKVHGDYDSISGGFSGEAVEDLTGGVTSKVLTDRILSKERLWRELAQVNKQFLFSASSPGSYGDDSDARRGLALSHAYSVIKVVEEDDEHDKTKKHRLALIRNPWGKRANAAIGEWTGPWSDGSSEWTPYWMQKLDHKFGDDGLFWMSYEDLLKRFDLLDRTRLFDENWTVVQSWTSVSVGWVTGYLNTKFSIEIKKAGPTVFVLCQLDDRYFCGLEGKYDFDLHFVLQEKDAEAGDHIVRARGAWFGNRSISAEIDLEVGTYEVLPKIEATRDADAPDVQEVVIKVADRNPQKLRQIGLNYDIANAKGTNELTEEEQKKKDQKKKEAAEKKKEKEDEEAKEKEAYEKWKKEEKAEYEAWKKERKASEDKEKPQKEASKNGTKAEEVRKDNVTIADALAETKEDGLSPSTVTEEKSEANDEAIQTEAEKKDSGDKVEDDEAASNNEAADIRVDESDPIQESRVPNSHRPPFPVGDSRDPQRMYYRRHPDIADSNVPPPPPPPARRDSSTAPKPWNAICVLGLRVYSQDPKISIKLVKPKNVEEGAMLDVDGDTAAGATM